MFSHLRRPSVGITLFLAFCFQLPGSDLPSLSFSELVDNSELIVSGKITSSWASWDPSHKHIWTHYELAVSDSPKGTPGPTVEIAEPGGTLDGIIMKISGTTGYTVGENVMVFLTRVPNGYLRTTGFGLGKYVIDASGHLHGSGSLNADTATSRTNIRSLDSMNTRQVRDLVNARVGGKVQ
jgi:hypothetical protein